MSNRVKKWAFLSDCFFSLAIHVVALVDLEFAAHLLVGQAVRFCFSYDKIVH